MENFVKNTKLYLFDMDGTLYLGEQLFDFTKELLAQIRCTGGKYLFITNNSSRSVADYVRKMRRLGIETTEEDFMTSAQATAFYLKKHHPGKKLYVCGTESFKEELRGAGFEITEELERVQCVVMGFDTELTFKKWRMFAGCCVPEKTSPISPPTRTCAAPRNMAASLTAAASAPASKTPPGGSQWWWASPSH